MFQLEAIKAAHAKVKSGADFPVYIQDLKGLGVRRYDTYVHDGRTDFFGEDHYQLSSEPKYPALPVADVSSKDQFSHYLKMHQQGQTGYPAFCKHAAETGVEKWTVDTMAMTCTYYDKSQSVMFSEKIPMPQSI